MSLFVHVVEYNPDAPGRETLGKAIDAAQRLGSVVTLSWRGTSLVVSGASKIEDLAIRFNERIARQILECI